MNNTRKWILLALFSAIAVFASGEAVGINWSMLWASTLYILLVGGLLLLIYAGGAAAIEAAKYYRNKNRSFE